MPFRVSFCPNLMLPYNVLNVSLVRCRDVMKRTWNVTVYIKSSKNVQLTSKEVYIRFCAVATFFKVITLC